MKCQTVYMLILTFFIGKLIGQELCDSERFIKPDFFKNSEIIINTKINYGFAIDWKGQLDTQWVNLFMPNLKLDSLKVRPFIILMHGGGFSTEDEFSNKSQWNNLCLLLAKRGFVAATIDYRVGWLNLHKPWSEYNSEERKNPSGLYAIYRAYQDARAAMRYFVHHSKQFGIDTLNIFAGGRSAGGDLSLFLAYYSQRDVDSTLNTVLPIDYHGMFGSLDSSTNNLNNHYKLRGIANMWGPLFDTTMISKAEALATPIIMFHGTNDHSVTYKKWDTTTNPFKMFGSYYIAQRYKNLGGCYQLNTKLEGGHGEDFSDEFLADRISTFFKNVICQKCISQEFASTVSLKWKIHLFFASDAWLNLVPVAIFLLIIILIIKAKKK